MSSISIRIIATAFTIAVAAPILAQPTAGTVSQVETAKARKVCHTTPAATGSLIPGKRVCRSAQEWTAIAQQAAKDDRGRSFTLDPALAGNAPSLR